jgi:hypothetical protein
MLRYDPNHDAYVTLGADPSASDEEIETAYRRSVLQWHPDKCPAPDAAERFHEVQHAGEILRDPEARRDYDIIRDRHIGRTFRPRRNASSYAPPGAPSESAPPPPAEPYVPMRPAPEWMSSKVKVHQDSVHVVLETPRPPAFATRICNLLASAAAGGAAVLWEPMLGALAFVLWAIGRVLYVPPHEGKLAWAKIVPGRRHAEFHILDQRHQNYRRTDIAFDGLCITLVPHGAEYRIELRGFPKVVAPVLLRTYDIAEAKRCAKEAGQWLSLPLAKAA